MCRIADRLARKGTTWCEGSGTARRSNSSLGLSSIDRGCTAHWNSCDAVGHKRTKPRVVARRRKCCLTLLIAELQRSKNAGMCLVYKRWIGVYTNDLSMLSGPTRRMG